MAPQGLNPKTLKPCYGEDTGRKDHVFGLTELVVWVCWVLGSLKHNWENKWQDTIVKIYTTSKKYQNKTWIVNTFSKGS